MTTLLQALNKRVVTKGQFLFPKYYDLDLFGLII